MNAQQAAATIATVIPLEAFEQDDIEMVLWEIEVWGAPARPSAENLCLMAVRRIAARMSGEMVSLAEGCVRSVCSALAEERQPSTEMAEAIVEAARAQAFEDRETAFAVSPEFAFSELAEELAHCRPEISAAWELYQVEFETATSVVAQQA
jgi:cell pole-organizing protein PopZ